MPNYMIPISEVCYKEFLNIKTQLKINQDVWSDSEILKLIFEKIDLNKDFIKELQTIGKSSKGRPIPVRNFKRINSENFEDLAKCPGCEHSICMLKHSLREMVRIEMHSHFDTYHNKSGFFQCTCGLTFDWQPAYLRHINICDDKNKSKQSDVIEDLNSNKIVIKEECLDKSFDNRQSANESSEFKILPKRGKLISQPLSVHEEGNLTRNSPSKKSSFNLYICGKCPSSFQNSTALHNHTCSDSEDLIDKPQPTLNISCRQLDNIAKTTEPTNSTIIEKDDQEKIKTEDVSNPTVPSSASSMIKLVCQCRQVFTDYKEYRCHTLICKEKPICENHKENHLNLEQNTSMSKQILKDCVPNSEGKLECPSCNKPFITLVSLKQHFTGMHQQDAKRKCVKCGKLFSWLTSYKYHIKKCFA